MELQDFKNMIKQSMIENDGIHIVAKSLMCDCEECRKEGKIQPDVCSDIFDGYVHSIGFHEKGMPELLFLVGPNGIDEEELTKQELIDRVQDAGNFINTIFQTRDTFKFNNNQAYGSPNINGLYWVIADNDDQMVEFIKHDLMSDATAFYDTCQFNVVVFKSHIHK